MIAPTEKIELFLQSKGVLFFCAVISSVDAYGTFEGAGIARGGQTGSLDSAGEMWYNLTDKLEFYKETV